MTSNQLSFTLFLGNKGTLECFQFTYASRYRCCSCMFQFFLYLKCHKSLLGCFTRSLFIQYYFLAVLCLCCSMRAFSSCGAWTSHVLASLAAQALGCAGFSSCAARAWLPCGTWNLPGPEIKPVFSALAGGFSTTGPPGKSI